MKVTKNLEGSMLTVTVEGRLDTTTAPALEDALKDALGGVEELALDFGQLQYISSAGLRVLLSLQKTMNKQGSMKVCNANDDIMEVFDITGFTDVLTIV